MSLKVWLPLDGDLRNLGASNVEVTNNGATIDDNGKIGKCYSFDGNTNFISLNSSALHSIFTGSNTPMSIAMWIYHNDSTRGVLLGDYGLGGINFNVELTTNHKIRFYWAGSPDIQMITIDASTWAHICLTYNGTTLKGYKNGVEVYSSNIILSEKNKTSGLYYLGRDYRTGQTALNGKINDVRIYDHCLSATEVHEISQGLILHYKLDGFNSNLIWNSNWQQGSQNWSGWGTPPTREIVSIDGKNWLHVISNTSKYQGYSQNWNNRNNTDNITQNTQVTVSYTAFSNTSATFLHLGFHWNNESGNIISQSWFSPTLTITPTRYLFTATTPTNCVKFNIMVGDAENTAHEIWITDIKLEIGNTATIWTPNENDSLGKIFSIDNNTVQDSSGYEHNGTINDTTLKFVQDSARYALCMMNAQSNNSSTYPFYGECNIPESTEITFTWWMKPTSLGMQTSGIFSTSNLTSPTDYNTTAANMRDSHFDCCNTEGTCVRLNVASFITLNEWHHYALTYNGTNLSFYKDGELKRTTTQTGSLKAFKYIFPFYSRAGGVSRTTSGYLSDFRIYCTPLLDNDIKMLYNVGMKVDNLQNLHTFNYVENEDSGTKTLTGDIITVEDAASKRLENLVININSTQSGSGDPSPDNVRPITGWTGAKVTRCGKNLGQISENTLGSNQRISAQYNEGGVLATATYNYGRIGYLFKVKAGQKYCISYKANGSGDFIRIAYGELDAAWGSTTPGFWRFQLITQEETNYQYSFTATNSGLFFFGLYVSANGYEGTYIQVSNFQLEEGLTATDYEPYQGETYSIAFPTEAGMVCTGTLDATMGLLTVNRVLVDDFTGLRSMGKSTSGAYRYQLDLENVPAFGESQQCASNVLTYSVNYNGNANTFYNGSDRFFIFLDTPTTAEAITWLESNSVVILYPLATPATYQLDPVSLTLLTGKNNIFADTGDISLEYSYYLPKSQKLTKIGQLMANNFNENKKASLYKNGFVEANNLIEI